MKYKTSFSIPEYMKKTGSRISAVIEEVEAAVILAAFKAISACTSTALDRIAQNSNAANNGVN